MAKIFTIAPGLENMGALRSGGQGSVYKGRRIGEIITAIKLLPTPIHSESEEDKNYRDFQNEVHKLKKVNEEPNPNVVQILSFGLSETGNFPYIEMAYIEGPDLEELLKPPHEPVFTIKEVIKVAEQLSNALSHCHKLDVRHGDVKSNNVKYNLHTGNYVLLDFGLAIMSDEQRRTSLRRAGAVEFMAPEQNEGQMLFHTDVYSFGVVIFELLAGRVPFPLEDKGETARNNVRLSHLETPPPDVMALRRENVPASWTPEKKARELSAPEWLLNLIYKCLEKKPQDRFSSGMELHEYIIFNSIHAGPNPALIQTGLQEQSEKLQKESALLQQQLAAYKQRLTAREEELIQVKALLKNKENDTVVNTSSNNQNTEVGKGVPRTSFIVLLLITIGLAAFSAYTIFKSSGNNTQPTNAVENSLPATDTTNTFTEQPVKKPSSKKKDSLTLAKHAADSIRRANKLKKVMKDSTEISGTDNTGNSETTDASPDNQDDGTVVPGKYVAISKAFFYDSPDESTKRNAFINQWNKAVTPSDEMNGFVYVVYTNEEGQTSRGWLRKKDLKPLRK